LQLCTGFWSFTGVDKNKNIVFDTGYPCRSRSQLIPSFAQLRQEFGTPITVNIDRDTVAVSTNRATYTAFERYCAEPGVDVQVRTSSVGAHWQNNYAEVSGKTAQEAVNAAMADMNVAPFGVSAWYFLADKLPRPDLGGISRFEFRTGTVPSSFEWRRPFCPALVYVPRSQRGAEAKWKPHVRRCVFLDYARGQQQCHLHIGPYLGRVVDSDHQGGKCARSVERKCDAGRYVGEGVEALIREVRHA
jgi:hypothetical protein